MPTMLMVSCRRDFWSPTDFSTTDEIRRLDLDSGVGTPVSQTEFLQALRSKRLTVLTHGYNNEERDVIDWYGAIDRQMRQLGFLGGAGAPTTRSSALRGRAAPSACRFRSRASVPAKARPVRAAARRAAERGAGHRPQHPQPRRPRRVRSAAQRPAAPGAQRLELCVRRRQRVDRGRRALLRGEPAVRALLRVPLAERSCAARVVRVGDLPDFDTALGYSGPEDPGAIIKRSSNVRVVNCKDVVQSHGGYRSSGQVWAYMSQQLTGPPRPSSSRWRRRPRR